MPLTLQAEERLAEFAAHSGDFVLFGIAMNPQTGEMATFSSHQMRPGAVLGFLENAVVQMVTAAANNELEYIGGSDAEGPVRPYEVPQAAGGKLVH